MDNIVTTGIKSKERVSDFGEVFTPANIVEDMMNLIPYKETEEEELVSNWLEPACGTGNFLVDILARKLDIVKRLAVQGRQLGRAEQYKNAERLTFKALCHVYGCDIQNDNVVESRHRLKTMLVETMQSLTGSVANIEWANAVEYILEQNIIWGDFLTEKYMDTAKGLSSTDNDITFTEWELDGEILVGKVSKIQDIMESSPTKGLVRKTIGPVYYMDIANIEHEEEDDEYANDF